MNFLKTLDWNTALHEGQNTLDLLALGIRFGYTLDSIPPPTPRLVEAGRWALLYLSRPSPLMPVVIDCSLHLTKNAAEKVGPPPLAAQLIMVFGRRQKYQTIPLLAII